MLGCAPWESDRFSLVFEWQQVSLKSLGFFFLFWPDLNNIKVCMVFTCHLISKYLSHLPNLWDCSKCINYIWYHRHLNVPQLLVLYPKVLISLFIFFLFLLCGQLGRQIQQFDRFSLFFFSFCKLSQEQVIKNSVICWYLKFHSIFSLSFSRKNSGLFKYYLLRSHKNSTRFSEKLKIGKLQGWTRFP